MTRRSLAWIAAGSWAFVLPLQLLLVAHGHAYWPMPIVTAYLIVANVLRAIRLTRHPSD